MEKSPLCSLAYGPHTWSKTPDLNPNDIIVLKQGH